MWIASTMTGSTTRSKIFTPRHKYLKINIFSLMMFYKNRSAMIWQSVLTIICKMLRNQRKKCVGYAAYIVTSYWRLEGTSEYICGFFWEIDYFLQMTFLTEKWSSAISKNRSGSSHVNGLANGFKGTNSSTCDIVNPFVHPGFCIHWYKWIIIYILTVILLPIRLLLVGLSLLSCHVLACIALSNRSVDESKKPMNGWREYFIRPMFVFCGKLVFFFCGCQWVSVKGQRAPKQEAPIFVVGPHSSYLDALVIAHLGMQSIVGKTETAKSPFGALLRMTQPVLVSREDPNSRELARKEIITRCTSKSEDWPQIIVFPEGTCTNRTCLINFKSGAFVPGVPVQPVLMKWSNKIDCVTWTWEGPKVWRLVWLCLTQLHTYISLEYLPVYTPSLEEKTNPELYARNVRNVMSKALHIPTTDYSYDDCRMMNIAKGLNLFLTTRVVELSKLRRTLKSQWGSIHVLINDLEGRCRDSCSHRVSLATLATYLQQPVTPLLDKIFQFYDRNVNGRIDLREFLVGFLLITSGDDPIETLRIALRVYSKSSHGHEISLENLKLLLTRAFYLDSRFVDELIQNFLSRGDNPVMFDDLINRSYELPKSFDFLAPYRNFLSVPSKSCSDRQKHN